MQCTPPRDAKAETLGTGLLKQFPYQQQLDHPTYWRYLVDATSSLTLFGGDLLKHSGQYYEAADDPALPTNSSGRHCTSLPAHC